MKKALLLLTVFCWCAIPVAAQSILSAQYPLGLPVAHSTGPSQGLAGSGVGMANDFCGMADNPGNLGSISRASFSTYLSIDYLSIAENGASFGNIAFSPQLLSIAFPLARLGTFGFSLDRRTSTNYKYRTNRAVNFSGSGIGVTDSIDLGIASSGGLSVWQAGWGYSFGRFAKIGVCYERQYLASSNITMMRTSLALAEGPYSTDTEDTLSLNFGGNGIRAGILFPLKKLTIGLTGEYVFSGEAKKKASGAHDTIAIEEKVSFQLPPSLAAGVSYQATTQWLCAASAGVTLWQEYNSGVKLGLPVDNAISFSLGGQYIPAPNLLVPRYWEIMQYRAGFRYTQLPVPTSSELALTLSLGLPVQQGGGLFDVIFEMGRRTDSDVKKYSENFVKIGLGINGGRKWFQNTGIRY